MKMNTDRRKLIRRMGGLLALVIFIVLVLLVTSDSTEAFDSAVQEFFYGIRSEGLTALAVVITNLSDRFFMIALCLILLIIPVTRVRFGVPLSAGALATVGVNHLIKDIIARPRPDVMQLISETGYSFPSGHSINSMFFYGMSTWLLCHYMKPGGLRNILIVILMIPMILVGPTRVYLGVHYPTDVLGAWCLAVIAIVIIAEIIEKIGHKSERP